jgi:hypothetical protein
MALEDGRFLVHPDRYDLLKKKMNSSNNLVRVSENFLVIAIGLPTPKYEGFSLDPPFRSRFQARWIGISALQPLCQDAFAKFPKLNRKVIERVVNVMLIFQSVSSDQGWFLTFNP